MVKLAPLCSRNPLCTWLRHWWTRCSHGGGEGRERSPEGEEEEGGGGGRMGSNLSKRRSQSSGNLTTGGSGSGCPGSGSAASAATAAKLAAVEKYKLCGSLPNHLDLPADNNNEPRSSGLELVNHHSHLIVSGGKPEDLGYGSEKSPEEEPSAAASAGRGTNITASTPAPAFPACPVHHAHFIRKYPFINSNSVFWVTVKKGPGGLGLSVTGGEPWPGLIRVKRLFPHQAAAASGLLAVGDILLAASGVPLLGLTNYEALEVLRSAPVEVKLTVCRPPETELPPVVDGPHLPPPLPPPRDHLSTSSSSASSTLPPSSQYGELEIVMEKQNGSLGFTLRKEDGSVLGHYVRALVREPALSDPRIRPGDKIVAVNDVDMSSLSHEEAVTYLRQCGSLVRLRLYRDPVQSPQVPQHSPPPQQSLRKPCLRKEAQDMLSELAVKKSQSPQQQDSSGSSKGSSPRKRRLTRTPPPPPESLDSLESMDEGGTHRADIYTPNLATQSSEEELVHCGLSGMEPLPSEPVSMPPLYPSSAASLSSLGTSSNGGGFSYRNPAYRSANPPLSRPLPPQEIHESGYSEQDIPSAVGEGVAGGGVRGGAGGGGLLKWKGVLFPAEGEEATEDDDGGVAGGGSQRAGSMTSQDGCGGGQDVVDSGGGGDGAFEEPDLPPPPPPPPHDFSADYQVVMVELNRGWNSRLGFSLRPAEEGGSQISAIYPDSVASRDGRLRIGDKIINVNDENIENMETPDVIDLLRKIRGSISLTLLRKARQ